MIFEIIKILALQVENYTDLNVELGNIANVDSQNGNGLNNRTVVTLVNYNEEGTLRNVPNRRIEGDRSYLQQPSVSLNLFLLFSNTRNNYEEALKDISKVLEYFQSHRVFTQSNTDYNRAKYPNLDNFQFHMDLHSISFEDLNYIWGSLGGKQYPSVLYKLRVVNIAEDHVIDQAGILGQTSLNAQNSTQNGGNQPL
jgi:hypothetical protein